MGYDEPVSLVVGVAVAAIGAVLLSFIVVKMVVELRRKRALLAARPERGEFDPDIERYLNRVWVLYQRWRDRLDAADARALEARWEEMCAAARELQARRADDTETSTLVGRLVELEDAFEASLAERTEP